MAEQTTGADGVPPQNAEPNPGPPQVQVNGHRQKTEEIDKPKPAREKVHSFGRPLRALTIKKGPPGGYDNTPLPECPQGYTLKFTFHRANNLPPSDFGTMSSDPFVHATLKGDMPKRHKQDPDLTHRTPTIRNSTTPEWEDEWVVANVPPTGFQLKCRLYDEDYPDNDDRLGNVTIKVPRIDDNWKGIPLPGKEFEAKKRMISKHAFALKGLASIITHNFDMTPRLWISIQLLGKSDPPYAQMCTLGPCFYFKHFSPMIGRLVGTKVNVDDGDEGVDGAVPARHEKAKAQKYDFQANEIQFQGPVPPRLYHRFVEFRPIIGSMFNSKGLRGKILNAALHRQHRRVYNFDGSTEYGQFEPHTEQATMQLLRMAHFGEGHRIFTYVITLDALMRFTETGHEFGIDMLSKHTMHSNVATYIACSGEFFVRRIGHHDGSRSGSRSGSHSGSRGGSHEGSISHENGHLDTPRPSTSGSQKVDISQYELFIDNDSGTYRPDKRILPDLKSFLEENLPGLKVHTMHAEEEELQSMKEARRNAKKKGGQIMNVVMNASGSSLSSAESELDARDRIWETGQVSKREAALAAVEDPSKAKAAVKRYIPGHSSGSAAPKSKE